MGQVGAESMAEEKKKKKKRIGRIITDFSWLRYRLAFRVKVQATGYLVQIALHAYPLFG